jgi:hypothetical protein
VGLNELARSPADADTSELKMLGLIELPQSHRVKLVDLQELSKLKDGQE